MTLQMYFMTRYINRFYQLHYLLIMVYRRIMDQLYKMFNWSADDDFGFSSALCLLLSLIRSLSKFPFDSTIQIRFNYNIGNQAMCVVVSGVKTDTNKQSLTQHTYTDQLNNREQKHLYLGENYALFIEHI